MQAQDDQALVRRCQAGDTAAFEQLVRKYQQVICNLVYHNVGDRGEVEDVAQKIFAKVYFSLGKFDNRRPFFPWLYRIAINQCYDELRRSRRRRVLTFTELSLEDVDAIEKLVHQAEPPVESREDDRATHALLHTLLDQLPEPQRLALVLRDLQDVPYDEMARLLGCTGQAARLKVFRARNRLRQLMERALRKRETHSR